MAQSLNRNSQARMMQELESADNVAEAMEILNDYFDLDNCRPGKITKSVFLDKLVGGMATLGAKPRKEHA